MEEVQNRGHIRLVPPLEKPPEKRKKNQSPQEKRKNVDERKPELDPNLPDWARSLAVRVWELRTARNESQGGVDSETGLYNGRTSELERGVKLENIGVPAVVAYAKYFETTVQELLGGAKPPAFLEPLHRRDAFYVFNRPNDIPAPAWTMLAQIGLPSDMPLTLELLRDLALALYNSTNKTERRLHRAG